MTSPRDKDGDPEKACATLRKFLDRQARPESLSHFRRDALQSDLSWRLSRLPKAKQFPHPAPPLHQPVAQDERRSSQNVAVAASSEGPERVLATRRRGRRSASHRSVEAPDVLDGAAAFLDLADSTFIWNQNASIAGQILRRLSDSAVDKATHWGGTFGNFTGDGFLYLFPVVEDAVFCLADIVNAWEPSAQEFRQACTKEGQ